MNNTFDGKFMLFNSSYCLSWRVKVVVSTILLEQGIENGSEENKKKIQTA